MRTLIIGLGNIGAEYDHTRHNIGFDVVDALASELQCEFRIEKLARIAEGRLRNKLFVLIKPNTFMNLSGKAVQHYMREYGCTTSDILVITDDLAIDTGVIRIRLKGSHGGHNGLRNIEELLQTRDYPRLRFGIGNSFDKHRQIDFVLGKWKSDEEATVKNSIDKAKEAVKTFLLEGAPIAMNKFNG